LRLGR